MAKFLTALLLLVGASCQAPMNASDCPDCAAGQDCADCADAAACADCEAAGEMCADCAAKAVQASYTEVIEEVDADACGDDCCGDCEEVVETEPSCCEEGAEG